VKALIILPKDVVERLRRLSERTGLSEEDLLLLILAKADVRLSRERGLKPSPS
jgi:cell division ATPase FtsA